MLAAANAHILHGLRQPRPAAVRPRTPNSATTLTYTRWSTNSFFYLLQTLWVRHTLSTHSFHIRKYEFSRCISRDLCGPCLSPCDVENERENKNREFTNIIYGKYTSISTCRRQSTWALCGRKSVFCGLKCTFYFACVLFGHKECAAESWLVRRKKMKNI